MSQCTATSKRTGERCKAQAITGKDKCYHHGGATPIKHGLDSKYRELYAKNTQELAEDPDLTDMRFPIAEIAGLAADLRRRIEESGVMGQAERDALLTLSVELTKAIKRYQDAKGLNVNVKGEIAVDELSLCAKLDAIASRRRASEGDSGTDGRGESDP